MQREAEDDLDLPPRKAPLDPDSALGRILGRDRYFYASLWAPAYIPGFTGEELLEDSDPVEREAGAKIYESFVRDMQHDHGEEEYRRRVELPADDPQKLAWTAELPLEDFARTWRPKSHAQIVRELVEHEKRERRARRAHLRVVGGGR
jgi:hypothetical protein